MSKVYKIEKGGLHDRFQQSRAKVQMFAGGFGNGKTTGAVIKAIQLAKQYPGSNGLVARSTYPKLTQTIRKEFRAWLPPSWVKRDVDSKENLIELTNGTVINFSHVAQTGKNTESSTSNLLSATYDWIVIDQIEDPEITEKDFLDLLGRLRGQTPYQGEDETMPSSGPRWLIVMCNPTRNWVYRKLVKPVHDLAKGVPNNELMTDPDTGDCLVEIFEGSTYENAANLPPDFISTLEGGYKGQMRERFLNGQWGAYEGLIYPQYDSTVHLIDHEVLVDYYDQLINANASQFILEAYDHGLAKPACYMFAFVNHVGDVFVLDGFYEKERTIAQLSSGIKEIRRRYDVGPFEEEDLKILADPSIFRRASGNSRTVGVTTAGLFRDEGIRMTRGNNDVLNGIAKVQSYLYIDPNHAHPIEIDKVGAPRFYVSKKCTFFDQEIVDYYWKRDTAGEYDDIPMDRNDHAMDTSKYLLTNRPRVATFPIIRPKVPPKYMRWREAQSEATTDKRKHRYA